jgi:UDP-glucose 4-epimerase
VDSLLARGDTVIGLDSFESYYPRQHKERNLKGAGSNPNFRFTEKKIQDAPLADLLNGIEVVFHVAAQPGVRGSWGDQFGVYVENNIVATQRLLEAVKGKPIRRFVYSSSSSVYGNAERLPVRELDRTAPFSPYGVTKLAGEHLALLYGKNYGVPVVALRYFTIYGPRQRPDMAFQKMVKALTEDSEFTLYGTGEQTRDFTFVSDAVEANLLAVEKGRNGGVYNIAGGSRASMNAAIRVLERISGKELRVRQMSVQPGDVRDTWADTTAAREWLGFVPKVLLEEGLGMQWEVWQK